MAAGSTGAVISAIGANTVITIAKFVGFGLTGSGAMLGEAIHSLADVFNQTLLFVGIKRSEKDADQHHPYGYHAERFVWALMSAVGVFFIGCGVTGYHGVHSLMHPEEVHGIGIALIVLIGSLILEGIVFLIALRAIKRDAGDRPLWRYMKEEADPAAMAVLLEDGVAVTGVLIALGAIGLTSVTGNPIWDAIGSCIIAVLLGAVALILIAQNKRLLVGPSAGPDVRKNVMRLVRENPAVEGVYDFKSRQLSVDLYRVRMDVNFDGRVIAEKARIIDEEGWKKIESFEEFKTYTGEFAERVVEALGDEIDALEAKIRKEVPGVEHVDIETE